MWWEMFSCNINWECCMNTNLIIISVSDDDPIFTVTGSPSRPSRPDQL